MPAIWHTWPRYSSTLSRWSARFMGSKRSTCLLIAIRVPVPSRKSTPSVLESYRPVAVVWEEVDAEFSPIRGRDSGRFGRGSRILGVARLGIVGVDHRGERRDPLVAAEPHHDHALCRAAEPLDVLDGHPDHGAAGRDEHHLVAVADDAGAGERALGLGQLDRLHAHAAAALARIVADARPLAIAILRHDEQVGIVLRDVDRDHLVVAAHAHALDAGRIAAHRAHLLLVEADRLAELRDHEDVVVTRGVAHADELVALAHLDRDDPVRLQRRVVRGELRLLHDAVLRAEDEVLRFAEVARLHDRTHGFVLPERQRVDDRAALRLAGAHPQLRHLLTTDPVYV